MFAGYLFLRFKYGREICQINPMQTLMNLQYMYKVSTVTSIPASYNQTRQGFTQHSQFDAYSMFSFRDQYID